MGPFYDAIHEEGEQDFDDDMSIGEGELEHDNEEDVHEERFISIDVSDIKKMKVADLKLQLEIRGIIPHKLKKDLVDQLVKAIEDRVTVKVDSGIRETIVGFPHTARWKMLEHEETQVVEPDVPSWFRAPTIPEEEGHIIPVKYNFPHKFERPPFTGQMTEGGTVVPDDGNDMEERLKGIPCPAFISENKLNEYSHPSDWFRSFCPSHQPKKQLHKFHMGQWTTYTNLQAELMDAGQVGGLYPTFTKFTTEEIEMYIFLYVLQGLSPSPRIEMKFTPQFHDPVNGNDLISSLFGMNSISRFKQFKSFFALQDPRILPPSQKTHPNFKVDPFLRHIQQVC